MDLFGSIFTATLATTINRYQFKIDKSHLEEFKNLIRIQGFIMGRTCRPLFRLQLSSMKLVREWEKKCIIKKLCSAGRFGELVWKGKQSRVSEVVVAASICLE